jgi:AraC family transcriptional regulator
MMNTLVGRPEPGSTHRAAVSRAITTFHQHRVGTVSLTRLSGVVGLSRFHFNRVFRRIVGIPPYQYQSLLRLDLARRLLLTTPRSIIDVSYDIGYQSLGTFTRRFTETLGMPPLRLRRAARIAAATAARPAMPLPRTDGALRTVQGTIAAPREFERGIIFVGLFHSPVPQGCPVRCCVLGAPGPFQLTNVDDGSYHVLAAAFDEDAGPAQRLLHDGILRASAQHAPLVVRDGAVISGGADLELRAPRPFDPPILTALLPLLADRCRAAAASFSNSGEDRRTAAAR